MRRHTSLNIDHEVIERCKQLKIDMSNECENHLMAIIGMRGDKEDITKRIAQLEYNKEDIQRKTDTELKRNEFIITLLCKEIKKLKELLSEITIIDVEEHLIEDKVKEVVAENRRMNYGDFCYDSDKVNKICKELGCSKEDVDKYFNDTKYKNLILDSMNS